MHSDELMSAFTAGLEALVAGEAVDGILARYEPVRRELRPMLEAAAAARDYARPLHVPAHLERESRARFLSRAGAVREQRQRAPGGWVLFQMRAWAIANRALTAGLVVSVALVLGTYGAIGVSAGSVPGEALYGVKRAVEQVQLLLAPPRRGA